VADRVSVQDAMRALYDEDAATLAKFIAQAAELERAAREFLDAGADLTLADLHRWNRALDGLRGALGGRLP
jgi:hypothetical protein